MKPKEKEEIMREFAENNIQVLSSTSVVEVGINIPNATIMCIE
jgi:ATP-dependent DNA helicase RecG